MESTSPKTDNSGGATSIKTTPTSANGKKLVQARLPFKILGGVSTVEPTTAATAAVTTFVEKRKRKLSKTDAADDAERAPKLNRIDGSLVANDLLSTEILDESVEYTMTDRKSIGGKSEVNAMKSECKENVDNNERKQVDDDDDGKGNGNVDANDDDDDVLEFDESSGSGLSDDIDLAGPRAKKCLNMSMKRTNDENRFIIKLPMAKKAKEMSKKSKKGKKNINLEICFKRPTLND